MPNRFGPDTPAARPLRGRAAEFRQLKDAVDDTSRNGARVAIVSGEAGIGKTTLISALSKDCADQLDQVVVHQCRAVGRHPLRGFQLFLTQLVGREVTRLAIAQLESNGAAATDDSVQILWSRRAQVFADITSTFLEQIRQTRVLLVVDDLHIAPQLLIDYLAFLVDEIELDWQHRLLIVLSTRYLPPRHRASEFVQELARGANVRQIQVASLEEEAEVQLITDTVGGSPSRVFCDLVRRSAAGNPLHVRATLEALRQRDVPTDLTASDPRAWTEISRKQVNDDPVGDWLSTLPPDVLRVLCPVSLFADEFDLAAAVAAARGDPAEVETQLRSAEKLGLLATDERHFWFVHSAYRSAASALLDPTVRSLTHLAVARFHGSDAPVRAAHHYLLTGDNAPTEERLEAYRRAAVASSVSTDWLQSARFYEAAIAAADRQDADARLLGQLYLGAAQVYRLEPDFDTARRRFTLATELSSQSGDSDTLCRSLVGLISISSATETHSLHRATEHLGPSGFRDLSGRPSLRAMVLHAQADAFINTGDTAYGKTLALEALELAERSEDPLAMAWAHWSVSFAEMVDLQFHDSLNSIREAQSHADASGDWAAQTFIATRIPFLLLASGDLAGAGNAAEAASQLARDHHDYQNFTLCQCILAQTSLIRGDFIAAENHEQLALESADRCEYLLAHSFLAPVHAAVRCHTGQPREARAAIESWPNLARSARQALLGQIAAASGDSVALPDLGKPAKQNQVTAGLYAARLEALLATGEASELTEAREQLEAWVHAGLEFPPSYPVSLTRLLAEVNTRLGDYERARALYEPLVTELAASGAHLERARALLGWAEAESLSDTRSSVEVARMASETARLADRMGVRWLQERAGRFRIGSGSDPQSSYGRRCALMMTDIVSSTEISHARGDLIYLETVMAHHEMVRAALARWEGAEFEEGGDSLFAWFANPRYAVNAAFEIQNAVQAHPSSLLAIRIGLAYGEPLFHNGRPYGLALNRAARIAAVATPGGVVADEAFTALLGAPFRASDSVHVELKGIGAHTVSTVLSDHQR